MNFKKCFAFMMCVVLLFAHAQVKPMGYCRDSRIVYGSCIAAILLFSYGIMRFTFWWKQQKHDEGERIKNTTVQAEISESKKVHDVPCTSIRTILLLEQQINHIIFTGSGRLLISQTNKGEDECFSFTTDKQSWQKYPFIISKNSIVCDAQNHTYHIGLRNIDTIVLKDSIEAYFVTPIISPLLSIEVADDAKIMTPNGSNIKVDITLRICGSENSIINLSGTAAYQDICFFDHAHYNAPNLKTKDTCLWAVDFSAIELCCENRDNGKGRKLQGTLFGDIFDKCVVRYAGNPRLANLSRNGDAKIERIAQ
jgi:hypothetical protein